MVWKVARAFGVEVEIDGVQVSKCLKSMAQIWGGGADFGEEATEGQVTAIGL